MAQNITLMGASFSAVPAILLPKTGGGTARFDDTTDANATASDILTGKTAYVNGAKVTGTNSGGGGGGAFTLLATKSLGNISTSATQAANTGQTIAVTGFDEYDFLVCVAHTSPHTNGRHVATIKFINLDATNNVNTKTGTNIANSMQCYKLSSSGTLSCKVGTTAYGVYPYSATLTTSGTRTITITIYQRYNSTSTGTLNGNYVMDVYGAKVQYMI